MYPKPNSKCCARPKLSERDLTLRIGGSLPKVKDLLADTR
jgi:hypothetical protein